MDAIKYKYIFYEENLFTQKNLIRDLVIDTSAKPIAIVEKENDNDCDTLMYGANLDEIKAKLN